ncbi:RNA polymerase Rpc34 subunit-domain-containing protein [Hygrophoropsis aurantiaca]|uniref:RNA polymerase Rpc34 subunit-domain-containing protein n=1 Tax=Hygrophoropsis aurantiaca TaxID=72124 RepID=A0ACB8AHS5_9AGAM|nr:RNA polymerase Rpc34 subunit-domain-containing protein [Hygrophoropsis aurantiaca]
MSARKLKPEELKLHQAALANNDKILTSKEAEKILPDAVARTAAVNHLLGTGLLKVLSNSAGIISFRAVTKKEMDVKKDMSGEEAMVLSHIQASANEGIWTKHLKAKTELHQTVIDRCLKSLVQKQLVKSIKAVRHPTRKIYMLAHLEPSVELTGGPWYTDNELDTEFIKLLSTACLHYIRDRSFPKQSSKRAAPNQQKLYAPSAAPAYPSAEQIQHFLSKSKITETQLGVDHVEMLLKVLELDGEIEKVPAFTASTWDAPADAQSESDADSDSEDDAPSRSKKRKHKNSDKEKGKRKRRRVEEDSESDSEEDRSKSKKKKKRSRHDEGSDSDGDGSSPQVKRKKKKRKEDSESENESDSEDEGEKKKSKSKAKSKRKSKSKKRNDLSSEASSPSESSSAKSKSTTTKHQSPVPSAEQYDLSAGGAFVYRAIRQERVALGWSQAPCGRCPVFDFCKDKGPTNPKECVYYEEWLHVGVGKSAPTAAKVEVEI